ncbi:hypothetical protein [Streptomyces sp. NPDC020951]|uniref:hypothetical protein n=1 Tax=Streptomyces sp. NPDC020951 TaxID=3365104 RepID=UPI0037B52B66
MVKNHRRKRDAQRRQEETGEGYQTALNAVRGQSPSIQAVATARQAVIAGNREIVDQLITEWLHVPLSEQWRAAVEMALMDDALSPALLDENCLALLRTLARSEHRRLVPLWMRRALGGRLVLLSEQTGIDATDHESPEAVLLKSEFDDKRLSFVLGGLTEQERQVVQNWAGLGGSWGEAATSQGLDAKTGERVRRKLRRLGAEQIRRAEAVAR